MIRHIFIGTFRDDTDDETKQWILGEMRAMKKKIPGIAAQYVGFSKGWAGAENQIVMTVDLPSREDFDVYMEHPYHKDHIDKLGTDYFDRSTFTAAQFELEKPESKSVQPAVQ